MERDDLSAPTRSLIEEIAPRPTRSSSSPAPRYTSPSFGGHALRVERLASAPGPTVALVVGLTCLVLGLSVVWKGDASETAAGFWPPAGAALAALMIVPTRRWGWVFGGIIVPTAVGLAIGLMPAVAAVWWATGNCVEPALAALAIRRFVGSRWSTNGRALAFFVAVAVIAAPMAGGAIGAIGTVAGYDERWGDVWLEWGLGDGMGVLVIAPLLLSYSPRVLARRTHRERIALVLLVATSTGLAFADIGVNGAALLPYLMLVLLIWAGMRFGTRAVAAAGFVVALGANIATSVGVGPFSAAAGSAHVITLQIFLAIALITSFVVASMASDLADHDQVSLLLTHQATHDALTGLPNRILFYQRLEAALSAPAQPGAHVAVLMIDLDDFKKINDRHGHPTGDRALRAAADLLTAGLRSGAMVARVGGDEFAVLIEGLASADEATAVATDLAEVFAPQIDVGTSLPQIGGSVGIALVGSGDPIAADDLVRRADIALYQVKRTPGLRVALFDDAIEAETRRTVAIAEELREAVDRGEMRVEFQPVISLASGRVSEFEALVRWTNRRFGVVAPDEFIRIAEDSGLISRLGDWVLEVACAQLADWRSRPAGVGTRVAVNVSARQLSDVGFPQRIRRILVEARLPADALTLEITETAVMDDVQVSGRVLADLCDSGVRLSMDDFGTGYSSMSNLRRTPLHVLKIDRSFIDGLGVVATDTAIVEATISLGHSFGLSVVAEGVETITQLRHLVGLGCDYGQGFLWSTSLDATAAGALLGRTYALAEAVEPVNEAEHLLAPN